MLPKQTDVVNRVIDVFTAPQNSVVDLLGQLSAEGGVSVANLSPQMIRAAHISADLTEHVNAVRYPSIHVYCENLTNNLREKFRSFSGVARMAAEIRVSHDRLEEIGATSQLIVDAVTSVLEGARGDWGAGVIYSGCYEVTFGPVKRGGKHLLQTTKIVFDLEVSRN